MLKIIVEINAKNMLIHKMNERKEKAENKLKN
jgi:hypothetical protein